MRVRRMIGVAAALMMALPAFAVDLCTAAACELECKCAPESQAAGAAQTPSMAGMPGMQMGAMGGMNMAPANFIDAIIAHASAGTTAEPLSTPHDMLMTHKRGWMLMLHGTAFVATQQQTGPRGGDKVFSTSWFMPMAQRDLGPGNECEE